MIKIMPMGGARGYGFIAQLARREWKKNNWMRTGCKDARMRLAMIWSKLFLTRYSWLAMLRRLEAVKMTVPVFE